MKTKLFILFLLLGLIIPCIICFPVKAEILVQNNNPTIELSSNTNLKQYANYSSSQLYIYTWAHYTGNAPWYWPWGSTNYNLDLPETVYKVNNDGSLTSFHGLTMTPNISNGSGYFQFNLTQSEMTTYNGQTLEFVVGMMLPNDTFYSNVKNNLGFYIQVPANYNFIYTDKIVEVAVNTTTFNNGTILTGIKPINTDIITFVGWLIAILLPTIIAINCKLGGMLSYIIFIVDITIFWVFQLSIGSYTLTTPIWALLFIFGVEAIIITNLRSNSNGL
jgi:hypothetical protein